MKTLIVVAGLLSFGLPILAQSRTGDAQAKGTCNAPNTGSNNRITIRCSGIGSKQGAQILTLLNRALAQSDSTAVLSQLSGKLDEILDAVNPNRPMITYDCVGNRRTAGPDADAALNITLGSHEENEENRKSFDRLARSANWVGLLTKSQEIMALEPEWLTPQLMAALANYKLGNVTSARGLLSKYEARSGDAYQQPPCQLVVSSLHSWMQ